jgi:hypothetical protein
MPGPIPTTKIRVIDGKVHVYREQDAEPIVEMNRQQRSTPERKFAGHSFRQVGRLPNVFVEKIINQRFGRGFARLGARERWDMIKEEIRRVLKNPDYKDFRTVDEL